MPEHSPEPWNVMPIEESPFIGREQFDGFYRIQDRDGHRIATVASSRRDGKPVGPGAATAQRIVACINACAGIPAKELEEAVEDKSAPEDRPIQAILKTRCGCTQEIDDLKNELCYVALARSRKPETYRIFARTQTKIDGMTVYQEEEVTLPSSR